MKKMIGSTVLSENILEGLSIIISFILIIMVVRLVFISQSIRTSDNLFQLIARDIALIIDRQSSIQGSEKVDYQLPKGVTADIKIDYKRVTVIYGDKSVSKFFSGNVKYLPTKTFQNVKNICFVKSESGIKIEDKKCSEIV